LVIAFFTIYPLSIQAQDIQVTDIKFATSVEDRQPIGVDTLFTNEVDNIYCFTQVQGAKEATQIAHVWYYKEEEKARIELNIRSDNWRTWSSKSILKSWTGTWRVMVEDSDGNVLATKSFVIKAEEEES
jgi:hypothetical protein